MVSPDPSPSFTWNAADYARSSSSQQQWAQELIAKLRLNGNERVLDIGCGDGKVTARIAACVPLGSVTGIDNSPEMCRFARKHFPNTICKNLTFVRMDACHLDFIEEFDIVFSNAALHWIFDHQSLLTGIANGLRTGGRLLVQMGGKGNAATVFEALAVMLANSRWARYYDGFSFTYGFFGTDEYRQWLIIAGFEPVRVELIPKDMVHSDREAFAGWIRTTWLPWIARLPEGEQPGFIEGLVDEYLSMYPADADGSIHIGMVRLEVEATKNASTLRNL
jgi:trans-aconitate 2-methyltransferase